MTTTSPVKVWRNQKKIRLLLGKRGTLETWTVIRVPPQGFSSQAPYPVGIVRFSDGSAVTIQIVDSPATALTIGATVELLVRRMREPDTDGVIPYGIKGRVVGGKQ